MNKEKLFAIVVMGIIVVVFAFTIISSQSIESTNIDGTLTQNTEYVVLDVRESPNALSIFTKKYTVLIVEDVEASDRYRLTIGLDIHMLNKDEYIEWSKLVPNDRFRYIKNSDYELLVD